MITANEGNKPGPMPEKPKKIVIPGVSVGGFKKEFERKASLTSTSPPKLKTALAKKSFSVDRPKSVDQDTKETNERVEAGSQSVPQTPISPEEEQLKQLKLKNAVNIISQALDKEKGALKSKSRPCMRKPPVPFGVSGRSASGSIGMITSPLSPPPDDRLNLRLQVSQIGIIFRCINILVFSRLGCDEPKGVGSDAGEMRAGAGSGEQDFERGDHVEIGHAAQEEDRQGADRAGAVEAADSDDDGIQD